jgi:hypothetical protein
MQPDALGEVAHGDAGEEHPADADADTFVFQLAERQAERGDQGEDDHDLRDRWQAVDRGGKRVNHGWISVRAARRRLLAARTEGLAQVRTFISLKRTGRVICRGGG